MKLSPHLSLFISQLRPYQPRSVPRIALLRPLSYHTHRFRNSNLAIAQAKRTPYLPTRNSSTIPTPTQSDQNINTIGQPGDGHIGNSTQTSNGKTPHEPSYTQATSNAHEPNSASSSKSLNIERSQPPSYRLFFTCKPCGSREGHIITKHGYHRGTILITCSKCKNRHIISDHLKVRRASLFFSFLIQPRAIISLLLLAPAQLVPMD